MRGRLVALVSALALLSVPGMATEPAASGSQPPADADIAIDDVGSMGTGRQQTPEITHEHGHFIGLTVVGSDGDEIGEVKDVVLEADGGTAFLVSRGGMLGIGTHLVALPFDPATVAVTDDEVTLTDITEDGADDLPAFEYTGTPTVLHPTGRN